MKLPGVALTTLLVLTLASRSLASDLTFRSGAHEQHVTLDEAGVLTVPQHCRSDTCNALGNTVASLQAEVAKISGMQASIAALETQVGDLTALVNENYLALNPPTPPIEQARKPGSSFSSCRTIKKAFPAAPSGLYYIKANRAEAFQVYCDMSSGTGGWTRVWSMASVTISAASCTEGAARGDNPATGTKCMERLDDATINWLVDEAVQDGAARMFTTTVGNQRVFSRFEGSIDCTSPKSPTVTSIANAESCQGAQYTSPTPVTYGGFLCFSQYDHYNHKSASGYCHGHCGPLLSLEYMTGSGSVLYAYNGRGQVSGAPVNAYVGGGCTPDAAQELLKPAKSAGSEYQSCREIKKAIPTAPDGKYFIRAGTGAAFEVHCDMTTGMGGWTRVFSMRSVTINAADCTHGARGSDPAAMSSCMDRHSDAVIAYLLDEAQAENGGKMFYTKVGGTRVFSKMQGRLTCAAPSLRPTVSAIANSDTCAGAAAASPTPVTYGGFLCFSQYDHYNHRSANGYCHGHCGPLLSLEYMNGSGSVLYAYNGGGQVSGAVEGYVGGISCA